MNLITNVLTLQMHQLVNFIVLEGENKGFYWYFLTQTIFVLIGNLEPLVYIIIITKDSKHDEDYKENKDFIEMWRCRKFLEMGFTRQEDKPIIRMERRGFSG